MVDKTLKVMMIMATMAGLLGLGQCVATITIKCNSTIPLGELRNVDSYKKTMPTLIDELFKINASFNHYSKLENDLGRVLSVEMHPFIGAVHLAFVNHLKLTISPDMIWHLVASGAANFINQNAETLRYYITLLN